MNWLKSWKFEEQPDAMFYGIKCREWTGTHPTGFPETVSGCGIDPGKQLGLAFIDGKKPVCLYHLVLPGEGSLEWGESMYLLAQETCWIGPTCIEGPALDAPYRQVDLERVRMAAYLPLRPWVSVTSPMTIRAQVCGYGYRKMEDILGDQFKKTHYHVLDAFAAALLASGWRWDWGEEGSWRGHGKTD